MSRKFGFSALLDSIESFELSRMIKDLYDGEESKEKPKDLDLRIISINECKLSGRCLCNSITPLALKQMIDKKIDPFNWTYEENSLVNLFLLGKKISLSVSEKKVQDVTKHIHQMGGIISDTLPDFRVTEKKEKHVLAPIVSIKWIDALYNSKNYVDPSSFSFESLSKKDASTKKASKAVEKRKDLGKNMKSPRQMMKKSKNDPEKLREAEKTQAITNFFTQGEERKLPKSQKNPNQFSDIPKPNQDVFMLSSPVKRKIPIKESPPPINESSKNTTNSVTCIASDYDDDDEIIRNAKNILNMYSSDKVMQEVLSASSSQSNSQSKPQKKSKFDVSSDSDFEEIQIYATDKMVSRLPPPPKPSSRPSSQTNVGCYDSDDQPLTYSHNDSPYIISPPPKIKPKGSSQESPVSKVIDNDLLCSSLCKKILSTKRLVLSPDRSPILKKPSYEEIVHFTQFSQSSQRETNDIDVSYCKNGSIFDDPEF